MINQTGNYILLYGCQPSFGVKANSNFIKDLINLISSNFDESGSVVLPDVLSQVLSSDAQFECVSSILAKKVMLSRQDTVVGHKRLFYAIDLADKSRDSTRKKVTNFFKTHLGFLENEIEFIDRTKFDEDQDGIWKTKFTDAE